MNVQEFLAWDATQTQKCEFVGGEVFAMAGAEDRHVTVGGNLSVRCINICEALFAEVEPPAA